MKFRSVLAIAALAASVSFATDVMTTDTVGWIKVTSTAKSTIVSVPWVQVGGDGASVQVAKLVKTDSLTPDGGVMLYYYDGTKYWAWALQTVSSVKTWVPATISSASNGVTTNSDSPAADYALPRGKALFIYRPNGSNDGDIYLYGKYDSNSPAAFTTAVGTSSTPAYTLIGNPNSTQVSLNSVLGNTNVGANDQILIPGVDGSIAITCTYKNNSWGWNNPVGGGTMTIAGKTINKPAWDVNVQIPPGRGIWYVSNGGSVTVDF